MRAPATVLGAGLAAALLLTACGGSGEEPDAAPSAGASATSSAAPSPAAGEDVEVFCGQVESVFSRVSAAYDPANVTGSLDESVAAFAEVQPPAEIADDWAAIQQGLTELRDTIAGTDLNTPGGQASAQVALTDFQTGTARVQQELEQYVTANCDTAATGAPSSAPTS